MSKTYIGIDNGVSGTIAILTPNGPIFQKTPVFEQLSYQKSKKMVTRIDTEALYDLLHDHVQEDCFALLERPMVNPGRFQASASALRAFEATLIVLEKLKIPFQFIDSKEWQKAMLPSGLKGTQLKKASKDVGKRLFPSVEINHEDADGLLIAEYARRMNL